MSLEIRKPIGHEENIFVQFSYDLSKFNRMHHQQEDDFSKVLKAREERARQIFNDQSGQYLILYAVLEDEYVGYALANIYYPDPSFDNGTELTGLLDEIYIKDYARGKGISTRLIEEVEKWMKEKRVSKIRLHSYAWNEHAQQLYTNKGFKVYVLSFEKEL